VKGELLCYSLSHIYSTSGFEEAQSSCFFIWRCCECHRRVCWIEESFYVCNITAYKFCKLEAAKLCPYSMCNVSRQSFLSFNTCCVLSPGLFNLTISLPTTHGLKASQVTANPTASKLKPAYSQSRTKHTKTNLNIKDNAVNKSIFNTNQKNMKSLWLIRFRSNEGM